MFDPLDRGETGDGADNGTARHQPYGSCLAHGIEIHPARDRDELAGPADPIPQVVPCLFIAQGNDAVCPSGRQPLQRDEGPGCRRGEVPLEDVAVWGVHDVRNAGQPGPQPPQKSGFGGVGVDDIHP